MNKSIVSILAVAGVMFCMAPANAKGNITYSYLEKGVKIDNNGFAKSETYDVAILIDNASLAGSSLTRISAPVTSSSNISGYKVWVSTSLKVQQVGSITTFTPNVCSYDVTPSDGYVSLELDTPVTIPAGGIYVGYSFTVDRNIEFEDRYPIVGTAVKGVKNSFFVHTDSSRPEFEDLSESYVFTTGISAEIEGDFKADFVELTSLSEMSSVKNKPIGGKFSFKNIGTNEIASIDYTVNVNGKETQLKYEPETPIAAVYGSPATVEFEVSGSEVAGTIPVVVTINKVNGTEVVDNIAYSGVAKVVSFIPVHKPLYEEYTGTWCGGCTRGLAAIEYFRRNNYDKCVVVSYHGGTDIMRIAGSPGLATEYPKVFLDRIYVGDPYHGSGTDGEHPRIMWDIEQIAQNFAPVDIKVSADWDSEEMNQVEIDARLLFVDKPEGRCTINFTLVHDGLTGDDNYWTQSNYDSGSTLVKNYPVLCEYADMDSYIKNFVYDDVAVYNVGRFGLKDNIITDPELDQEMKFTYSIPLSECISDVVANTSLIQDKTKLRVVVSVIDIQDLNKTKILNSAEVLVPAQYVSVSDLNADKDVENVEYYDLSGVRTAETGRGLFIKVTTYSDGSRRSEKVVMK